MIDAAREQLCRIVERYGDDLGQDPRRCAALLRDLCGQSKRQISVLEQAARAGIPGKLRTSRGEIPTDLLLKRLSKALHDDLGLTEEFCRWSVESWALALNVVTEGDLTFRFECPACQAKGNAARRFTGRSVRCPRCNARVLVSADGTRFTADPAPSAVGSSSAYGIAQGLDLFDADNPFLAPTSATAEDMLRQIVRRAFADGMISPSERDEMLEMRRTLGLSPEIAARIFAEVKAEAQRTALVSGGGAAATVRVPALSETVRVGPCVSAPSGWTADSVQPFATPAMLAVKEDCVVTATDLSIKLTFYQYVSAHFASTHWPWAFGVSCGLLAAPIISFLKPALGLNGLHNLVLGLMVVATAAGTIYLGLRFVNYVFFRERSVTPQSNSWTAVISHGAFFMLLPLAALVAIEHMTPNEGLLSTLVPELKEQQSKLFLRWNVADQARPGNRDRSVDRVHGKPQPESREGR